VKIASGKFQGLMQTNTPRPNSRNSLRSPVGPGSDCGFKCRFYALSVIHVVSVWRFATIEDSTSTVSV
jgi:hypothetical protein